MPHEFVGVPQFVTAAICRAFYVVSTTLHCVARQATQAKARRARGAITLGIIQISYATASIRASSTDSEEEAAATARASRHRTTASRRPPAAGGITRRRSSTPTAPPSMISARPWMRSGTRNESRDACLAVRTRLPRRLGANCKKHEPRSAPARRHRRARKLSVLVFTREEGKHATYPSVDTAKFLSPSAFSASVFSLHRCRRHMK